jgi:hypothetical protein
MTYTQLGCGQFTLYVAVCPSSTTCVVLGFTAHVQVSVVACINVDVVEGIGMIIVAVGIALVTPPDGTDSVIVS